FWLRDITAAFMQWYVRKYGGASCFDLLIADVVKCINESAKHESATSHLLVHQRRGGPYVLTQTAPFALLVKLQSANRAGIPLRFRPALQGALGKSPTLAMPRCNGARAWHGCMLAQRHLAGCDSGIVQRLRRRSQFARAPASRRCGGG